jgi:uncharacterized protein (UPF0332 family)
MTDTMDDKLLRARDHLRKADLQFGVGLSDEAGRSSYLAAFHAAQAYVWFANGKSVKSHNGTQNEFFLIVKDDARFDRELQIFLSRSYNLKAIADYEGGPSLTIHPEIAQKAIETATRFVALIESLVKDAK